MILWSFLNASYAFSDMWFFTCLQNCKYHRYRTCGTGSQTCKGFVSGLVLTMAWARPNGAYFSLSQSCRTFYFWPKSSFVHFTVLQIYDLTSTSFGINCKFAIQICKTINTNCTQALGSGPKLKIFFKATCWPIAVLSRPALLYFFARARTRPSVSRLAARHGKILCRPAAAAAATGQTIHLSSPTVGQGKIE